MSDLGYLSCVGADIESNSIISRLTDVPLPLESELALTASSTSLNSTTSSSLAYQPKYSLRARSIQRRIEVEVKQTEPKSRQSKAKCRPAPLSKYRRKTANAKERSRMRDINSAFDMLERSIPQLARRHPRNEKVTKITVLRLAINYIRSLSSMLESSPSEMTTSSNCSSDFNASSPSSVSSCTTPSPTVPTLDFHSASMTMTSAVASDALDEIGELTDFQLPHELVVFLNSASLSSSSSEACSFSSCSLGSAALTRGYSDFSELSE